MAKAPYGISVFVNVPFDEAYKPLQDALIFTVFDCGYVPRCTLEGQDCGEVRIDKIADLIGNSRLGIHDISRVELDRENSLPRFNMPFELGIFLGARKFGDRRQREKKCLILDEQKYRYQKFLSDIAGQDIKGHEGKPERIVEITRDWLRAQNPSVSMPSGADIYRKYKAFLGDLPFLCNKLQLKMDGLGYIDYTWLVSEWLKENAKGLGVR